jgi:hypothetical protein
MPKIQIKIEAGPKMLSRRNEHRNIVLPIASNDLTYNQEGKGIIEFNRIQRINQLLESSWKCKDWMLESYTGALRQQVSRSTPALPFIVLRLIVVGRVREQTFGRQRAALELRKHVVCALGPILLPGIKGMKVGLRKVNGRSIIGSRNDQSGNANLRNKLTRGFGRHYGVVCLQRNLGNCGGGLCNSQWEAQSSYAEGGPLTGWLSDRYQIMVRRLWDEARGDLVEGWQAVWLRMLMLASWQPKVHLFYPARLNAPFLVIKRLK